MTLVCTIGLSLLVDEFQDVQLNIGVLDLPECLSGVEVLRSHQSDPQ